jgi:hypothetical protein
MQQFNLVLKRIQGNVLHQGAQLQERLQIAPQLQDIQLTIKYLTLDSILISFQLKIISNNKKRSKESNGTQSKMLMENGKYHQPSTIKVSPKEQAIQSVHLLDAIVTMVKRISNILFQTSEWTKISFILKIISNNKKNFKVTNGTQNKTKKDNGKYQLQQLYTHNPSLN